jgi:hypothetical protein
MRTPLGVNDRMLYKVDPREGFGDCHEKWVFKVLANG